MQAKISINKLGEYMTATPARRKQILRDQKSPPTFKAARYKPARDAIVEFLGKGMSSENELLTKADALRQDYSGSDFATQDKQLSADAIENFLPLAEEIDVQGLTIEAGDAFSSDAMNLGGVQVTMRLDAVLKDASGAIVGCVKLNFSKSAPLDSTAAEYVATALRVHLEDTSSGPTQPDPDRCYVVDIPTGTVCTAPKAKKRRLTDLHAAGEEIAARWESL